MEAYNVLDLLPQRPPFVFIDRLVDCTAEATVTSLTVREDHPFFASGRMQAPGLLENIAQTCATRIGYLNKCNRQEIKIGVIGAVRDLRFFRLPAVGETLTTRIEVTSEVMALTLVEAAIRDEKGELIATCEMKIAVRE